MSNVAEQLQEMAKLTLISGRINEIQKKNLETFPFVFFNDVKQAKISYDFSNNVSLEDELIDTGNLGSLANNASKVSYTLTLELKNNENLDARYSALAMSVKNVFWKSVSVNLILNDKPFSPKVTNDGQ